MFLKILNSNVITGMDMSIILKVALLSFPVLYVYKRSVLQTCLSPPKKQLCVKFHSVDLCAEYRKQNSFRKSEYFVKAVPAN